MNRQEVTSNGRESSEFFRICAESEAEEIAKSADAARQTGGDTQFLRIAAGSRD